MGSKFAAVLLLVGLMAAPSAHASNTDERETLAKVRGIFVQLANGVLMEERRVRRDFPGTRWADVDLGASMPAERRLAIVQLPAELRAEVGDLLTISASERAAKAPGAVSAQAPIERPSRAVGVKARWFTEEADRFGRSREDVAAVFQR